MGVGGGGVSTMKLIVYIFSSFGDALLVKAKGQILRKTCFGQMDFIWLPLIKMI